MTVWLHGANNNHLQSIFEAGFYVGTRRGQRGLVPRPDVPGGRTIDAALPATIQISVLGRGETLRLPGHQRDRRVRGHRRRERRLGIDPDRVTISGASMGGIGTYRLGHALPGPLVGGVPAIGSGEAMRPLFPNLRNVPVRQLNGRLDNGALGPPSEQDAVTLDALGYDHKYFLGNDRGHEIPGYYGCVFATTASRRSATRTRTRSCTGSIRPSSRKTRRRDVSIRYDSAYWVSGIRVHGTTPGQVTARSLAIPHTEETITRSILTGENQTAGHDLCGPNPTFPRAGHRCTRPARRGSSAR